MTDDQNLKLSLDINRAIDSKDPDRLIETITTFMEKNRLRARADAVTRIPVQASVTLLTPNTSKKNTQ